MKESSLIKMQRQLRELQSFCVLLSMRIDKLEPKKDANTETKNGWNPKKIHTKMYAQSHDDCGIQGHRPKICGLYRCF